MFTLFMVDAGFLQQLSAVLDPEDTEHNVGEVLKRLSGGRTPSRVICTGHRCAGHRRVQQ